MLLDAFVDDTSLGFTDHGLMTMETMIAKLNHIAQTWESILFHSGADSGNGRAVINPWKTEPGVAPPIPFIDLRPEHLLDYIGQQKPPTSPAKTFIFSFRLCLTAGPRE